MHQMLPTTFLFLTTCTELHKALMAQHAHQQLHICIANKDTSVTSVLVSAYLMGSKIYRLR